MNTPKLFAVTIITLLVMASPQASHAVTLADAVARIDAMIAEMNLLKAQLTKITPASTPTSQVLGVSTKNVLTMDLSYGETNDDISKVQKLLATDPSIYPEGIVSGFYGPKTQNAVRLFQSKFGLDTVGVIGPSTKALLELFLAAYPDENYPADVLQKGKPSAAVLGASTSVATPPTTTTISPVTTTAGKYSRIVVSEDDDEYIVRPYLSNGERDRDLILYPEDEDELVEMIADKLNIAESEVRNLVDLDDDWFETKKTTSSKSRGADEDDAEEAIDDADRKIDRVRDRIKEAEEDDIDVDKADQLYDEARDALKAARLALKDEEYDDVVDFATEAEELADEADEELDDAEDSSSDIDVIEVTVRENDSKVFVEYENGDDDKFTVEETDREDIIKAVANELDVDDEDVEDVIEFDYGEIERVDIKITEVQSRVRIYFSSGFDLKYITNEEEEDKIIEEVADEYDLNENDIKRVADVDDQR